MLQMVLQIREYSTGGPFDDDREIDFPSLPLIKPAQPQLSPDPRDWLPPASHRGTRSTVKFSAGASRIHVISCLAEARNMDDTTALLCNASY